PAMVPWRASEDGEVTDHVVDWYRRLAQGRPGALVVEATGIRDVPSGPLLRIGADRFLPGLRRLVAAVREASGGRTRLLIQLIDFLAIRRRPLPEKFFYRFFAVDEGHRERLAEALDEPAWLQAPEAAVRARLAIADPDLVGRVLQVRELRDLNYGYRETVSDTHLPHIAELPQVLPPLFAAAAVRARAAGFDGVELHYAHAYTMAGFLSRLNQRGDGYGGSPQARQRLPLEVYRAVRGAVGRDFVVGCRFLGDEVVDAGSRIDDATCHGVAFAQAGMDFLSVSKGGKFEDARQPKVGQAAYPYTGRSGYECMPTVYSDPTGPFGRNVHLSAAVRRAVRANGCDTPVVAAGGIHLFRQAESILGAGHADIVALARQALADPDWFEKVRTGHGAEVRRCHYTNYCEALDQQHREVTCQLWDKPDPDDPSPRSRDGRRRLIPPPWRPEVADRQPVADPNPASDADPPRE
ncbi:MAG: NADH:flavin oxidoreductase, partial [Myxococcales bacterium]|nr:NADH:flavin oxidoreductase [Myxococcales bacterium]